MHSKELSMDVIKSLNGVDVSNMTNESCIMHNLQFLQ